MKSQKSICWCVLHFLICLNDSELICLISSIVLQLVGLIYNRW